MRYIDRLQVPVQHLPGRSIQRVIGKDASIESARMTVGIARYAPESGVMEPHQHAEETIFILDAHNAWVRYGPNKDDLPHRVDLRAGLVLHFAEWEWHVFEWGETGYADSVVIYGQVDDIRPEDRKHPVDAKGG